MSRSKIIIGLFLSVVSTCLSAAYTCSGPVSGLATSPNGDVFAESLAGLSWPHLCNLTAVVNGIPVPTCEAIYSMLLTAQVSKKEVILWFNDEATGGSCQSHTPWAELTGWYFGPQLLD